MTIEITRAKSRYVYRTNPANSRLVERRRNKERSRWELYRLCRSTEEARSVLLKLERSQQSKSDNQ